MPTEMRTGTLLALPSLLLTLAIGCGSAVDVTPDPEGTGGAGGSGGAPPGQEGDDCTIDSCAEGLFCDFPDDQCGTNGTLGACRAASMGASTETPTTVCGCDGEIYSFWFQHENAGFDSGSLSFCEAPAGKFHCGDTLCDADGMTYCSYPDLACGGGPAECATLPPSCLDSTDCACFPDALFCEYREDGVFEVACPEGA